METRPWPKVSRSRTRKSGSRRRTRTNRPRALLPWGASAAAAARRPARNSGQAATPSGRIGVIRVGVGGWTFPPWRNSFYPKGLKHADELTYAASKLTAIEINATFYRTQSAASFAKWREQTGDGFQFTVKGHRAVVTPRRL